MTIVCREDWTPGLTYELPPQDLAFIPANFEEPGIPVSPHSPATELPKFHCCIGQPPPPFDPPVITAVPESSTFLTLLVGLMIVGMWKYFCDQEDEG